MAIVSENSIGFGFRGKIGGLVFRSVEGKTIVSAQPEPNPKRKISARQQQARTRFSEAAAFARSVTRGQQKLLYAAEAKRLGLPNAYTAAVTLYLRGQQNAVANSKAPLQTTQQSISTDAYTQYTTSFSTNTRQYAITYSLRPSA